MLLSYKLQTWCGTAGTLLSYTGPCTNSQLRVSQREFSTIFVQPFKFKLIRTIMSGKGKPAIKYTQVKDKLESEFSEFTDSSLRNFRIILIGFLWTAFHQQ